MKKFFSFLTAILASVTLASALEITVPATTLDLQNPTIVETAGWTGETAYYLDDDVLIVSGYEAYKSVAKQTWITFLSTGSSSSTWKALAPFKGSDYYTNKNYSTLQSNRYTAYLVTNCDSVWAYGCNNAATAKYLVMNVYEITGEVATINTESVEPTYSVSNEAAGKADVVLKQALDATKKYLVVTTGAGASNSRSYETAFFRHPDATPKTSWTVAGSSATVFGTAWDPTNKANDMKKQADGSYKWEKTELELAAGSVDFKVCKDHAWDEAYPASNYNLAIAESGIYTITITFEPENSNKVSAVATKTGSLVVLPEVKFHGNFFGTWADTDPFTAAEDKLTAELTLSLTEGTYEFGCKFDGTWKANGATLTREAPATSLAEGSGNMKLVVDQAGDYVFTYTFLGEQLAVTYPKKGTPGAYTLTFNGTGTSSDASSEYTKDGNIFTDDCKAYVTSVDTISKVYAARIIAENTSSLKFGTSSVKGYLEFTLATPVEVDSIIVNATQYGNNAAEVTVNGVKFDLTAGNKKPQDCKLVPNGIVSKITIAQTGSERIYLRYVTIYAKTTPTPPTPATLPVVALAGTMNGWSTTANVLVAAEDSLSASVKIALEAGRDTFKIVSDGKWLSLNGEGESLYAFHRDWTSASHINGIDLRNFELTADVAGEYTFTWTYADSTLTITFPAKPQPVDDKIIFEWTKGTGAKVEADKTDLNANNMGTMTIGTFVQARLLGTNAMDNNAKGYKMGNNDVCVEIQGTKAFAVGDTVIITGVCGGSGARAFAIAPNTTINAAVDTALTNTQENTSDILEYKVIVKEAQAGDTMRIFRQAGKSMYLYSIKVVRPSATPEPPVTAKYYVTGDSALVTDAGFAGKAWNPAAIKAEADTLVLNLKAEQVYKLKVTLDGTWNDGKVKGFNDLTEKPEGVTMDNDENIIFSLAEAGAVKVIYIAGETPIFKLIGNFYVDPTPVVPTAAVTGDMTEWGEPIPFELSEDSTFATLYNDNIKKGTYAFKMIINGNWRSNGYEFHRGFPGCAGITGNTEANMTVVIDVEGAYTFKWYFANDSLAIIYPEKPEPAFKDGFYLVGKFGGVDAWNIDKNKILTSNPSAEGEYMLENVTLAAGDSLKVVWVEDDEIITWYPGGDNYVVDAKHAGVKTIYFRPDGQGGEDWFAGCIYIAPNEPTAITNVNADAKAVKSLKNGILMIEKNGKVYNVIGLQIR